MQQPKDRRSRAEMSMEEFLEMEDQKEFQTGKFIIITSLIAIVLVLLIPFVI